VSLVPVPVTGYPFTFHYVDSTKKRNFLRAVYNPLVACLFLASSTLALVLLEPVPVHTYQGTPVVVHATYWYKYR
jgi:hypothetical protein